MIIAAVIIVIAIIGVYYFTRDNQAQEPITLKIFHAGSLTVPFEEIEARFEEDFPNVDVQLEPAGSVQCVQKVTELGEIADIVASADYTLIPSLMIPDYTDWYIAFARNEMTLAFVDTSKYANEINEENWFDILSRDEVKWGFSNPNLDPCGYRTPMVFQLAELYYEDDSIFETHIQGNTDISVSESEGTYIINSNIEDLNPNTDKISIRDKSVELVSMVQSGGLDYAFEYSSVAKQHELKYLDLPAQIDLSDLAYEDTYNQVKIELTSGTNTGLPIVYGITIPNNAEHPDLAAEFVMYLINEQGQQTFEDLGQPPISPPLVNDMDKAPESLKEYLDEMG
jgi:molybdate/tungstate transport system substrate-binding protein